MKLRILIALLSMLTLTGHAQDSWSFFSQHRAEDAGWRAKRKDIIKMSVLFGKSQFSGLSSRNVAERTALILDTWHKYRLTRLKHINDPEDVVALAWSESAMRSDATSSTHDKGIMQVSFPTAKEISRLYGLHFNSKTANDDLRYDNAYNVLIGLCEFDYAMRQWGGKVDLAILAYKVGHGRLSYLLRNNKLTKHYVGLYHTVERCSEFLTGTAQTAQSNLVVPKTAEPAPSRLQVVGNGPSNIFA